MFNKTLFILLFCSACNIFIELNKNKINWLRKHQKIVKKTVKNSEKQ